MKKLAAILCLTALTTGAFAQGLVNFANTPSTLISVDGVTIASGHGGQYWFALLQSPKLNAGDPAFTDYFAAGVWAGAGPIATNQNAAGRITGGIGLTVPQWAAGDTHSFFVVGWSADNGSTFNPAWITAGAVHTLYGDFKGTPTGFFGVSAIAPGGIAGGGPQSMPNLSIFGGTQGIPTGFNLVPVPEPATIALAGLAAALVIFRRRN